MSSLFVWLLMTVGLWRSVTGFTLWTITASREISFAGFKLIQILMNAFKLNMCSSPLWGIQIKCWGGHKVKAEICDWRKVTGYLVLILNYLILFFLMINLRPMSVLLWIKLAKFTTLWPSHRVGHTWFVIAVMGGLK